MINSAMVLAAGLGLRLRPITFNTPKPLIKVNNRALVDYALDRIAESGIDNAVVNTHHLAGKVEQHLRHRHKPHVLFSREDSLLETGGGVKQALPLLGNDSFLVMNADVLWLNGPTLTLGQMCQAWDDSKMDALVLVHSTVSAYGYHGKGDFVVDPFGRAARRPEGEVSPYMFTGTQILHPRLFTDTPDGAFSLNRVYDRAIEAGRFYAVIHDGECFHVGTPDGLAAAEAFMDEPFPGREFR